MALGTMAYTRTAVGADVEILYNSEYVGDAITLDATAFTSGVCLAGTPIAIGGTVAVTTEATESDPASSDVYGILLHDVYSDRPQGTVVIGGYINKAKAEEHIDDEYDTVMMATLKNVVFVDKDAE